MTETGTGPIGEAAPDYLIGQVISECKVLEKVGEGGFGTVYKAIDQNLQRPVALKVMLRSLSTNQEFVQKFIREAVTAAQLNHPNIVGIHKVDLDERRGLDLAALDALKSDGASVADLDDGRRLQSGEIIGIDCEILVPAARPDVITADNADDVKARLVIEGANIPATSEAEARLHERGVLVIPDFIANAGGVICAAVEYHRGSEAAAMSAIDEKIARNAPLSVRAGKRMVYAAAERGWSEALQEGDRIFEPVYRSEDAQEGPRAFREKRDPVWKGR